MPTEAGDGCPFYCFLFLSNLLSGISRGPNVTSHRWFGGPWNRISKVWAWLLGNGSGTKQKQTNPRIAWRPERSAFLRDIPLTKGVFLFLLRDVLSGLKVWLRTRRVSPTPSAPRTSPSLWCFSPSDDTWHAGLCGLARLQQKGALLPRLRRSSRPWVCLGGPHNSTESTRQRAAGLLRSER